MSGHPQDLSLGEQARAVAAGELGAAELLEATLERIAERDPGLGSVVATFPEESRRMLKAAPEGPLRGVPVGVKDLFNLPWRAPREGSSVTDLIEPGESGAFRALRDAGAVVAAVTQCHLYGGGSTGHLSADGPVGNPWDRAHCGGGSSGGSAAAVGARLVAGALGSDGGGSIRLPAAYCGVTGLKSTFGWVPHDGFLHGYNSLAASGPMCRDAADARLLGEVLCGRPLPAADGAKLRIGVARRFFWEDLDPEVQAACERALEALSENGATLVDVEIEGDDLSPIATVMRLTLEPYADGAVEEVETREDLVMKALAKYQLLQPGHVLVRADRLRSLVRRELKRIFESGVDVIAWPTVPAPAPRIDNPTVELPSGLQPADHANVRQSGVGNLTGVPGVSCPAGLHSSGLPIGLQFLAAWGADAVALDAAQALEDATGREHVDAEPTAAAVAA